MLSRRDFLKYAGLTSICYYMDSSFANAIPVDKEYVEVNIPEFKLRYTGREYLVSVGKPSTPTPIGKGIIYQKIDRPVFRYKDPGPNQGKIIQYTEDIKGRSVKVPYDKFRSIGIRIHAGPRWGLTERYRLHSTTEYWNMGKTISDGCIRVNIPDMLELYPLVPLDTEILVKYDTIKMDDTGFIVFPDVYKREPRMLEILERRLKESGIKKAEKNNLANILENHLGRYVLFSEL